MILNQKIQEKRIQISEIIKDLHQITIDIGNADLANTVSELRNRIEEPFMFVIVGEVKAGKSSFINALLSANKEICKVAPDPCTDTIQQVIYGEEEGRIIINDYLHKIVQPVEILKEIAIVDTPGTNTIVKHHQEITERFVPASDLIVFVFEAKNPYRQSAWEFFDYIHAEWRKKIVFVLQQSDLMEDDDLETNINGVKKYAIKKGINNPNIFAVSAKRELKGQKEESGFNAIRSYISDNITGGKAPVLKLQNNIDTAQNINDKIKLGLSDLTAQHNADVVFRADIDKTLIDQESFSYNQIGLLVENLLNAYDRVCEQKRRELKQGLGFFSLVKRSISSIFVQKSTVTEWLEDIFKDLETDLNDQLHLKLNEGVVDIADSIQRMVKMIDLKIKNSQTILKNNHEIFGDLADQRSNILRELQAQFSKFMNRNENFVDAGLMPKDSNFSPDLAAGSGIAIVGVVLATVTQGAIFDITGGIISTLGLLFAGVTASMKRRKVLEEYDNQILTGRNRIDEEIDKKLKTYTSQVKKKVEDNFKDFDILVSIEGEKVEKFSSEQLKVEKRLFELEKDLT